MPDTPFTIHGLIPFYPSRDLAATADFYGRELGLEIVRDQGSCLIFRVRAGAYLGFCLHDGPLLEPPGVVLTLLTEEVDAVYKRLRHHGIETEGRPKLDERLGIHRVVARDPDGHRVEVLRFLQPLEVKGDGADER